jgi:hypothetical protein
LEADGSDESLLSEETLAENAWPRALPADGGRPGTETETETGTLHFVAEDPVTDEYTLTLGVNFLLWGFPLALVVLVVAETLLDTWWREPRK